MNPESFQAPSLEELAPLFPNYSIDAFIAQGGMGAVYLATQTSLEREVAIKILPREFGRDEEFRSSFAAEAKAMAKLNHPNLIGVYDFGEVDGMPFIVMEYVAGKSLHDSSYGKQIDPAEAARIVVETCRGLHHAHEHDILHRDVKPANILMDPHHAEPKLGDFGLAMAASDENDDGLIYGTPGYAAPEVYEGQPDARSDVYAAAVILYQLLTGQMPETPYQHPSTLARCDRRFDTVLAKALQPDAHSRFQSAGEFANELEAILKKPAVVAMAPSPVLTHRPTPQLASAKKGSGGAFIGIIAALAALGVGIFFLFSKNKQEPESTSREERTLVMPHSIETDPNPISSDEEETSESGSELAATPSSADEAEPEIAVLEEPEEETPAMTDSLAERESPEDEQPDKEAEAKEQVSTFDHLGFLKRGRDFCVKNADKALTEYREKLIKNIDRLEREGKSILRDDDRIDRESERASRDNLELLMDQYRKAGRLPSDLLEETPDSLARLNWREEVVERAIREALDQQDEIERDLEDELKPLAISYATGVRKQADKLQDEGNDYDAQILGQEADQAEESFSYFLEILNGNNPTPSGLGADSEGNVDGSSFVVGNWLRDKKGKEIVYSFFGDGTVLLDHGRARGKWTQFAPGTYRLDLKSGVSLTLEVIGADTLEVNGGIFELKRESETIVGQWKLGPESDPDVVFTFTDDNRADNGKWNEKGSWAKTSDGYRVSWNSGRSINLEFVGPDELKASNSDGEVRSLFRK
jgi:serine/threonine-protein kinase